MYIFICLTKTKMDQKNPKKMGKMGVTVAALLVLVAGGVTFFGGQSEWLQGALQKLFQKPAIQTQVQTVADEPILGLKDVVSPDKVTSNKDTDREIYRFKVDKDFKPGKPTDLKLGLKVGKVGLVTTDLNLKLWGLKDGVRTDLGLLSKDLSFPGNVSFNKDTDYIITAKLSKDLVGKDISLSLLSKGLVLTDSDKVLTVVDSTVGTDIN
jgi:hypothetical protein